MYEPRMNVFKFKSKRGRKTRRYFYKLRSIPRVKIFFHSPSFTPVQGKIFFTFPLSLRSREKFPFFSLPVNFCEMALQYHDFMRAK